ncbi:hypothetical protein HanIR_Chr17g0887831 [Helianthus annuus]|nr:hypothetical protein HanIR_Chr17g0887831 [Helianthus annuus]
MFGSTCGVHRLIRRFLKNKKIVHFVNKLNLVLILGQNLIVKETGIRCYNKTVIVVYKFVIFIVKLSPNNMQKKKKKKKKLKNEHYD